MPDLVPGVPGGPEERTPDLREINGQIAAAVGRLRCEFEHDDLEKLRQLVKQNREVIEDWRERSRGLEEAAKFACFKLQAALDDSTPWPWQEVEQARTKLAASLSAVPDVQDDDGYEARSASPGAAREGQDVDNLRGALAELVAQIDLKFPKGQSKRLPGPSLYAASERARRLL